MPAAFERGDWAEAARQMRLAIAEKELENHELQIEQAKADWRAGRMKLPDYDNNEFIPLPGDPAAPANPMS